MVKPITPEEVAKLKVTLIPDDVIAVINKTIAKHFNGRTASFTQDELVKAITLETSHNRQEIYANKWLDFEPIYREQGWKVKFDNPAYNESYAANFTFTAIR